MNIELVINLQGKLIPLHKIMSLLLLLL